MGFIQLAYSPKLKCEVRMKLSIEMSSRFAVSFVLTIAPATVLDATIVGFVAFSNLESPTQHYLVLFVGIFVLFSFCWIDPLESFK